MRTTIRVENNGGVKTELVQDIEEIVATCQNHTVGEHPKNAQPKPCPEAAKFRCRICGKALCAAHGGVHVHSVPAAVSESETEGYD